MRRGKSLYADFVAPESLGQGGSAIITGTRVPLRLALDCLDRGLPAGTVARIFDIPTDRMEAVARMTAAQRSEIRLLEERGPSPQATRAPDAPAARRGEAVQPSREGMAPA